MKGQSSSQLKYSRILLKLSGESMASGSGFGVDMVAVQQVVKNIVELKQLGVEVAIVIGGGNFLRGEKVQDNFERVTADQMGMLFTVANGLLLRTALQQAGLTVSLMSSFAIPGMVDIYNRQCALEEIEAGKMLIFTGGVGAPFFSTDSAAALRAIEINADVVLKASTVDGVYSADPKKDKTATRYDRLSYQTILEKQLRVMDLTAICLCQDHNMPVLVFDMNKPSVMKNIVLGLAEGTLITSE